jgi:pSer/pThr/pTyr-binding forkhead associated (FHA) protein
LPVADAVLIDRSRALEARLTDPFVSRVHCQVQVEGGRVFAKDFDSAGGTFVNGKPVSRKALAPGDVMRIAGGEIPGRGGVRRRAGAFSLHCVSHTPRARKVRAVQRMQRMQ